MCVFLLYVLIVLKLCIFSFFALCYSVYIYPCSLAFLIVYFTYDSYNNNNKRGRGMQWVQVHSSRARKVKFSGLNLEGLSYKCIPRDRESQIFNLRTVLLVGGGASG